jgi:hypothetical protein
MRTVEHCGVRIADCGLIDDWQIADCGIRRLAVHSHPQRWRSRVPVIGPDVIAVEAGLRDRVKTRRRETVAPV